MVSSLNQDKFTKCNQLIIYSLLFIYTLAFLIREPIRKIVYSEMAAQISTVDVQSWAVYSNVDAASMLNYFRAVREGWMLDDSWMEF
jgi:hypothetical protein